MSNPWCEAATSAPAPAPAPASAKANNHNISLEQQQELPTCGLSTLKSLVKLWHILDALLGVILFIYGLSLLSTHLYLPICLTLGMAMLLCIRSMAGLSALTAVTHFMGRRGLQFSGMYLSPLAAIVFFAMSCLSSNHVFATYLHNHQKQLHLPSSWLLELQQHHPHILLITFSIATLIEMIRWFLVPMLYQWLVHCDTHMVPTTTATTTTTTTTTTPTSITPRRKRPWWWQQHQHQYPTETTTTTTTDDLHHPLLENHYPSWVHNTNNHSFSIDDGTSQQQQQHDTSFWSKWFGPNKEEGEVSFQSIQEEWASKSEEDPLWWSREEEERNEEEKPTVVGTNHESLTRIT